MRANGLNTTENQQKLLLKMAGWGCEYAGHIEVEYPKLSAMRGSEWVPTYYLSNRDETVPPQTVRSLIEKGLIEEAIHIDTRLYETIYYWLSDSGQKFVHDFLDKQLHKKWQTPNSE